MEKKLIVYWMKKDILKWRDNEIVCKPHTPLAIRFCVLYLSYKFRKYTNLRLCFDCFIIINNFYEEKLDMLAVEVNIAWACSIIVVINI